MSLSLRDLSNVDSNKSNDDSNPSDSTVESIFTESLEMLTPGCTPSNSPTRFNYFTSNMEYKAGAPVVQVKSIHSFSTGGITVRIPCCYCFEEHEHGDGGFIKFNPPGGDLGGVKITVKSGLSESVPDELGHREAHCHVATGACYGYNISTVAWKLSGRAITLQKENDKSKKAKIDLGVEITVESIDSNQSIMEVVEPSGTLVNNVVSAPITSYLDRLLTTSKVFFDHRFIEIIQENKKLKLRLFWKDHNCEKLKEAMSFANQKAEGPDCNCLACGLSGRKNANNGKSCEGFHCLFKSYFEALLLECGITTKSGGSSVGLEHESAQDSVFDFTIQSLVYDIDVHFVTMAGDDWYLFTYGAKLWKERSVESAELQKLSLLFQKLCEYTNEGIDDE